MATLSPERLCNKIWRGAEVPEDLPCADWADEYFYLPAESSNTSGLWETTTVQRAILNAFGNDAIEKVDFFKSARFGGTKMCVIANAYQIAHKRRNVCFYQPTKGDSESFVKNEIDPAIRDCEQWNSILLSDRERSPQNTLSFKAFLNCNAYFRGGHSPNSFRRLTLDTVILDELDGFKADVGREGNPTTLSWGRVKNSVFKKQIQISTPTITGFSLIEKSAKQAEDVMLYHVACPHCGEHGPLEWGGKDVPYGFKWEGRDPESVRHYGKCCSAGWGNDLLQQSVEGGFWLGENGYKTVDGIDWEKDGVPALPPRHIAFKAWSAYSPFSPWSQIVEEWYDAQGDILKLQAFTNTTLGQTWDMQHSGSVTQEAIDSMIPIEALGDIIAITAGIDVQDDRIEIQYAGHDIHNNLYVMGYDILHGDMTQPQIYVDMYNDVMNATFQCGDKELKVINACIDTQGHHTENVHKFLVANKRSCVFVGINGNGTATYEMADKAGTYKGVKDSVFYSIGVNVIKQGIFTQIRNFDKDKSAFKIAASANLPSDYSKQLTAEKMEIRRVNGLDRVIFTNEKKVRNEALDTLVYAVAAKAYIRQHRGRQGRALFGKV